jgi:hypothetical protein
MVREFPQRLRFSIAATPSLTDIFVSPLHTASKLELTFTSTMQTNLGAAYSTILTRLLVCQTLIILPLSIFTLICPPAQEDVIFPAPRESGTSKTKEKTVSVLNFPSFTDLGSLLLYYLLDIIFLYPYTFEGITSPHLVNYSTIVGVFLAVGHVFLLVQFLTACTWKRTGHSWVAAERHLGLWHSRRWSAYYVSFIITGIAIGFMLAGQCSYWIYAVARAVAPVIWDALSTEYAWLKMW